MTLPLPELALLLRLRSLRVAAAARECARWREAVAQAEAAMDARRRRIDDWRARRCRLALQTVGSAAREAARLQSLIAAQRAYLDDQLERDEYGLIDDEEERDAALARLAEARALCVQERAREDGVRDLQRQARAALQRRDEQRAALESDERRVPAALGAPTC